MLSRTIPVLTTFSLFLLTVCISFPDLALAQQGTKGGDVECEKSIRSYYFPTIQHWLITGGPENTGGPTSGRLDLSFTRYPGTTEPYTLKQYEDGMESIIPVTQSGRIDDTRLHINCVSPGDPGWPVSVKNAAKICSSYSKDRNFYLTCKASKFVAIDQVKHVDTLYSGVPASERPLNANGAIEQIHHEAATWVGRDGTIEGLEPDTDDVSTYEVSKQLSDHVRFFEVPMLVVGKVETEAGAQTQKEQLRRSVAARDWTSVIQLLSNGADGSDEYSAADFFDFNSCSKVGCLEVCYDGELELKSLSETKPTDSSYASYWKQFKIYTGGFDASTHFDVPRNTSRIESIAKTKFNLLYIGVLLNNADLVNAVIRNAGTLVSVFSSSHGHVDNVGRPPGRDRTESISFLLDPAVLADVLGEQEIAKNIRSALIKSGLEHELITGRPACELPRKNTFFEN